MKIVPHKIAVTKEILDFIKNYNVVSIHNGKKYYNIPYWFVDENESNDNYTALTEYTEQDLIFELGKLERQLNETKDNIT